MISKTTPGIAYVLGYAGLLPFLVCAVLAWFDEPINPFFIFHVFHIYSIVVLAFLGGTWWGFAFAGLEPGPRNGLLVSSVVLVLLLCVMLVNLQNEWTVALLGLGYALLYTGEYLFRALPVDSGYRKMRLILTLVVVLSHVSVFFSMT